jgi:hypothetical protein
LSDGAARFGLSAKFKSEKGREEGKRKRGAWPKVGVVFGVPSPKIIMRDERRIDL